ncbi:acyl-CoA dehydrogenase [candidate division KSB1 bacterium]|nr:acyl-CoA dehydrogenase [candidate division KSB1 bacterium]NIR70269.1 acyl-CoA dehydrogenase [candidate division KSB1 bacterium]NIS26539.1 acyl-CoA dehydrogenase [candidate division KSB1 bacterium]NIT73302.1 acyl-CoA dehydrogenase [candidate division KSB1 bacterium]NIU23925.1 acyl-CoA dehydrogenase [candidate division KSB1 bacterium]
MASNDAKDIKSFSKCLFAGSIEQSLISPFPKMDEEEQENLKLVLDSIRQFMKDQVDPAAIDQKGEIPDEVIKGLAEIGLFGMSIPEEYGGYGFSSTAYNRVFEELAGADASLAVTLGGHQSIGLKALLLYGSEEQKKKYLPELASGESLAAFALTEPGAGSDAAGIQSMAIPDDDNEHYILNGSKIWTTNGGIADFFTVFAKTPIGENEEKKITAFIVTRDMEGFSSGKEEEKLGIHGSSTTEITFDNIKVPKENVIGTVGKGFKVAMEVLNSGRLGLAAGCVGGMKQLLAMSVDHAKNRKQFNAPIAKFEMIQEKISQMAVDTFAAESMIYLTTGLIDRGDVDYSIESAICKVYVSEALWRTVNETMQIAGGIGYSKEYPYERYLRDSRINLIFEGTNEVLRLFISLAGMQEHGEYLKKVGKALQNPLAQLGILTDYAISRLRRRVATEKLSNVHEALHNEADKFAEYAKQLHFAVERVLSKYRKEIIEQEFLLHRIADMAIDLYAMAAVVSRLDSMIKASDVNAVQRELTIGKTFCEEAWRRIRRNSRQIDNNIDSWRRQIATHSYEANGYDFDL